MSDKSRESTIERAGRGVLDGPRQITVIEVQCGEMSQRLRPGIRAGHSITGSADSRVARACPGFTEHGQRGTLHRDGRLPPRIHQVISCAADRFGMTDDLPHAPDTEQ